MSEEAFRELLDEHGILRAGAMQPPPSSAAFTVFSQQPHPVFDAGALRNQAKRFFATKLGSTVDKKYGAYAPSADAARVVVSSDDESASGTRLCFGRPVTEDDLCAADRAERDSGSNGMALLAKRCPTVWLVAIESDNDRVALTIAAIFASVLLGPILPPKGDELFGVRTARMKLEGQ